MNIYLTAYRGHDHPQTIPGADILHPVLLTVEDSQNFQLAGYESDPQWEIVGGDAWGYVRLKPVNAGTSPVDGDFSNNHKRMFVVTMFHELHCLRLLNLAFDKSNVVGDHHIIHCLNYLRQMAMCDADLTIEVYDWEKQYKTIAKEGSTHVCRDWMQVIGLVDKNWKDWMSEQAI
ncbi:hypothetical protein EV360DRAFT_52726 [Lentinula raphanica]|nr:hypothetical protein EV360DRAFT_52726 [Lentinula raphanica]